MSIIMKGKGGSKVKWTKPVREMGQSRTLLIPRDFISAFFLAATAGMIVNEVLTSPVAVRARIEFDPDRLCSYCCSCS